MVGVAGSSSWTVSSGGDVLYRESAALASNCKCKAACLVCLEKNGILPASTQKWILSSPGIHHKSAKMQGGMVRIEELLTHLRANHDCIAHQFYISVIESLFPHLKAYLIAADDYAPDQCDGFFLP